MSEMHEAIRCLRCLRSPRDDEAVHSGVPTGWEGSVRAVICPGCQYAEWHPLCDAIVDFEGGRLGYARTLRAGPILEPHIAAMPAEELDAEE
jgi:hypothetical protein